MESDRFDRLERLFRAAQMHAPEERAAFLDAACADDPSLRTELDELLEADARAEAVDFLDEDPRKSRDRMDGRQIGPYVVLRRLGHGGMGDVYLGLREQPFKQYVALKIMRPGAHSGEVIARFQVERQILAALNHPGIARLLDGGVTEEGLPYFAMEYVSGRTITAYCEENRLGVRKRLQLFQTVCQAVHYAHQNLVIHRDLKPSNVLVTEGGVVKLLDFGIAKLLNPHLSPVDIPVTRSELRMMTPEYASPEQLRSESLTTAADVYSLGVILYELLTGERPFDLAGRPFHEIVSIVNEQDPDRPSARAEKMRRRHLQGDLDNIVLMALRREPDRRYASAEQLAHDVERHLTGLPVVARPNTVGYRIRKFATRNKATAIAGVLVAASLLGGLSAALWQAGEAHRERDRAEEALARSETVSSFLVELFEATDPRATRGADVTARELLERGVRRAERLNGRPELQAHLLGVIGLVHENLGQYEQAQALLERTLALRRGSLGERHPDVHESTIQLASILTRRGSYAEAERLLRDGLATQERDELRIRTMVQLGHLLPFMGKWQEAEEVRREVVNLRRSVFGEEHPQVANGLVHLAAVLRARGRYEEAEAILRRALDMHLKTQGEANVDVSYTLFQLATLLKQTHEYEEMEQLLRRAMEVRRRIEGEWSPEFSSYLLEIAYAMDAQGKSIDAERTFREALAHRRHVMGDHPSVTDAMLYLANFFRRRDRLAEADSVYRDVLTMRRRLLGEEHLEVAVALRLLGRLQLERDNIAEAESLLSRSHRMHLKVNGPDHHHVGAALADLAAVRERTRDYAGAERLYREALDILRKNHSDEYVEIQQVFEGLSAVYAAWDKPEEAQHYRTLLRRR